MRKSRNPRSRVTARQLGIGRDPHRAGARAQLGCTREFYREWANQDVSEAVFEKTRDPRWRMDIFSVEPPALSRFADPYDQEVPPAPPDDPAAEALSPVPQWPDNRLLVPVEGHRLPRPARILETRRRSQEAQRPASTGPATDEPEYWQRPDNGQHPVTDPRQPGCRASLTSPAGPPVPPETARRSPSRRRLPRAAAVRAPGGASGRRRSDRRASNGSAGQHDRPALRRLAGQVIRLQDDGRSRTRRPLDRAARPHDETAPRREFRDKRTRFDAHTSIEGGHDGREAKIPRLDPGRASRSVRAGETQGAKDRAAHASLVPRERGAGPAGAGAGSGMRTEILQMVCPSQDQPAPATQRHAGPAGTRAPASGPPARRCAEQHPRPRDRQRATPPRPKAARRGRSNDPDRGRRALAESSSRKSICMTITEGYGYPKGSRVYKINMQQALLLAIMNARFYQYNLETGLLGGACP